MPAFGSSRTFTGSQYRLPGACGRLTSRLNAKTACTVYSPAGRSSSDTSGKVGQAASSVTTVSAVTRSASAPSIGRFGGSVLVKLGRPFARPTATTTRPDATGSGTLSAASRTSNLMPGSAVAGVGNRARASRAAERIVMAGPRPGVGGEGG